MNQEFDYEKADARLEEFVKSIDSANSFKPTQSQVDAIRTRIPSVRAILRRLEPGLGGFRTGGFVGWTQAREEAILGRGMIKTLSEDSTWLGPEPEEFEWPMHVLHPTILGASRKIFSQDPRQSVVSASENLISSIKTSVNRHDVDGVDLWNQVFSTSEAEPGKPRLRWPGDPSDRTVRSMQDGLREYSKGVQRTIRNVSTHSGNLNETQAFKQLIALSLLAEWVEECELVEYSEEINETQVEND